MEPGLNFKTRGGFQVTPPASLALFSSREEEGEEEPRELVSRGYFTLGSRFSRLPVNFFPVICLRLGGRRNGREEWGKKKKKGRMATDVLPLWQNANRELGFLPPSLRKLGPT